MKERNIRIYKYMQRYSVHVDEIWRFRHETEESITSNRVYQIAEQDGVDAKHISDVLWVVKGLRQEAGITRAVASLKRDEVK